MKKFSQKSEETVIAETNPKPEETVSVKVSSPFKDRKPCNWHIVPKDSGTVIATNNVSREVFEGSMKDFNVKMRG